MQKYRVNFRPHMPAIEEAGSGRSVFMVSVFTRSMTEQSRSASCISFCVSYKHSIVYCKSGFSLIPRSLSPKPWVQLVLEGLTQQYNLGLRVRVPTLDLSQKIVYFEVLTLIPGTAEVTDSVMSCFPRTGAQNIRQAPAERAKSRRAWRRPRLRLGPNPHPRYRSIVYGSYGSALPTSSPARSGSGPGPGRGPGRAATPAIIHARPTHRVFPSRRGDSLFEYSSAGEGDVCRCFASGGRGRVGG